MKLKKMKKLERAFDDAPAVLRCDKDMMGSRMHAFVVRAEMTLPVLFNVARAAEAVVENWDNHDLALFVTALRVHLEGLK